MDEAALRALLDDVTTGRTTPDDAVAALRRLPFADVGDALVDHHRALRQGMPEAVYCPGKSPEQVVTIVGELLQHGSGPVLITRASDDQVKAAVAAHGEGLRRGTAMLWRAPEPWRAATPLVVSAGTADLPVVDEAVITLQANGFEIDVLTDVGVAGIHRLLAHVDRVTAAAAIIVVAGMEGALASVIGGHDRSAGRRGADQRRLRRRSGRGDRAARDARVAARAA